MRTMHKDFSAMLLALLPQSYDSCLSAVTAALSVLGTKLTPDALMLSIIDKFNCHTIKTCQSKDKSKDIAFHAKSGPGNHGKVGRDQRRVSSVLIATGKDM